MKVHLKQAADIFAKAHQLDPASRLNILYSLNRDERKVVQAALKGLLHHTQYIQTPVIDVPVSEAMEAKGVDNVTQTILDKFQPNSAGHKGSIFKRITEVIRSVFRSNISCSSLMVQIGQLEQVKKGLEEDIVACQDSIELLLYTPYYIDLIEQVALPLFEEIEQNISRFVENSDELFSQVTRLHRYKEHPEEILSTIQLVQVKKAIDVQQTEEEGEEDTIAPPKKKIRRVVTLNVDELDPQIQDKLKEDCRGTLEIMFLRPLDQLLIKTYTKEMIQANRELFDEIRGQISSFKTDGEGDFLGLFVERDKQLIGLEANASEQLRNIFKGWDELDKDIQKALEKAYKDYIHRKLLNPIRKLNTRIVENINSQEERAHIVQEILAEMDASDISKGVGDEQLQKEISASRSYFRGRKQDIETMVNPLKKTVENLDREINAKALSYETLKSRYTYFSQLGDLGDD